MAKARRSLYRLVEHFNGPRGKQLLEVLAAASKSKPVMSEDRGLAT